MGWHRELSIGTDPERLGAHPRGARIGTGALTGVGAGEAVGRRERPVARGVKLPADARTGGARVGGAR